MLSKFPKLISRLSKLLHEHSELAKKEQRHGTLNFLHYFLIN